MYTRVRVIYIQLLILLVYFPYQSSSNDMISNHHMSDVRSFVNITSAEENSSDFSLLSYNVLSQRLLEKYSHFYDWSDESVLKWNYRKTILLNEIRQFNADIICFQEVQESHLEWFIDHLSDLGYKGVFKKKTGSEPDGCAIYYKNDKFTLREQVTVEYNQPGVNVLDCDNVGIVLRLSPWENDEENLIVSTTHILYSQNRRDTQLAQVHLLLAEIERVSYKGYRKMGNRIVPIYHPIILTGDFNLEPSTAAYEFLINGALNYSNLQRPTLSPQNGQSGRPNMGNELVLRSLGITENSQHANVLESRKLNNYTRQTDDSLFIKLNHTERKSNQQSTLLPSEFKSETGNVYHSFNFSSVYNETSCSTYQDHWILVDYIFYTSTNVKLKAYMKLPSTDECQKIPKMPNRVSPSDHLPLFAKFSYPIY